MNIATRLIPASLVLATALISPSSLADETATTDAATESTTPLNKGSYVLLAPQYLIGTGSRAMDDGVGGTAGFGYRNNWYAFELASHYASRSGPKEIGGSINALVFPFNSLSGLYATAGVGSLRVSNFPTGESQDHFNLMTLSGGLGYLLPIQMGNYEFGIRSQAVYRLGHREERRNPTQTDLDASRDFKDVVLSIGLHLPLGGKMPAATEEKAAVVPTAAVCADGMDNDGDGNIDFPADKGCSAADDIDETDPPACSDGLDNDGDGLIDFPADKGCTASDDTDETDLCKTPETGEKVSLSGCSSGDVIVLRGVNFEFDKSRLTSNAKTLLDTVVVELDAHPQIRFELGGHTDAKGSDEYNQRLSEQRADSVMRYLADKGIAEDRMTAAGYGEAQPVADNETEEGRELNRRVELKIVSAGESKVSD